MVEAGNAGHGEHLQLREIMMKEGRTSVDIPSLSSVFLIQGWDLNYSLGR